MNKMLFTISLAEKYHRSNLWTEECEDVLFRFLASLIKKKIKF